MNEGTSRQQPKYSIKYIHHFTKDHLQGYCLRCRIAILLSLIIQWVMGGEVEMILFNDVDAQAVLRKVGLQKEEENERG